MNDLAQTSASLPATTQPSTMLMPVIDPAQMVERVKAIQYAMEQVMVKDVHYGVIEGTQKPTLYKPGSEILLVMFGLSVNPIIEDLNVFDKVTGAVLEVHYRVRAELIAQGSGNVVGYGVGECTTAETKYAWTYCNSNAEWDATDPTRRREVFKRNGDSSRQLRASPQDKANTILKMAKKRAQVDGVLTTLGCSDMFEQDLEDYIDGEVVDDDGVVTTKKKPRAKAGKGDALTESQCRLMRAQLGKTDATEESLCKHMGVGSVEQISKVDWNKASEWISKQAGE